MSEGVQLGLIWAVAITVIVAIITGAIVFSNKRDKDHQEAMHKMGYVWVDRQLIDGGWKRVDPATGVPSND